MLSRTLIGMTLLLASCRGIEHPETPLIALTPVEYNNSIRDLFGMPNGGAAWPDPPEIAARFTAGQGEQAGLFGGEASKTSPWPWPLPDEVKVDGFDGIYEGQGPSAYKMEELQKAAVHFASYSLVSSVFFSCDQWAEQSTETQATCGWESVKRFAQRAYRRPLTDDERSRLKALWQSNWDAGTPEEAVVLTTAAVLQAPQFLFKVERGDEDLKRHGILPLSDWEMASRLSYFLWDSVPDPQLFAAAEAGELTTEAGIREQVQRMLADPKAHDAMIRFHQQWLQLDGLYTIAPARSAYGPSFGLTDTPPLDTTGDGEWPSVIGPLRHALDAEFQLFVSHVVFDSDGTLKELFTSTRGYASSASDIIHIDSTPADGDSVIWSYGNVVNSGGLEQNMTLTPVTYPSDQRSGILTLPAVNAVGAYPVHPDPIHRGLRVLERVACMDLGAPPASAESASPADIPEAESTNRFRTENATSPSNCQGCHVQINPPGFAFENYDSLGAWRTQDNGEAVDASGSVTLHGGETINFSNAMELSNGLATTERVQDCYSLRWARVATGEQLDPDDERLIDLQASFRADDDIKALLENIAVSALFRNLNLDEVD